MERWINGKHYDVDSSEIIYYSEEPAVLDFPKGYRFASVKLMKTPTQDYFLYGYGHLGCHSIVPITEKQVQRWMMLQACPV